MGLGRKKRGDKAAPTTGAQFSGVWLVGEAWGQQASTPNVGVIFDRAGVTVTGPAPDETNMVPWTHVHGLAEGPAMAFPDGGVATVVEMRMPERTPLFLVRPDQLAVEQISLLEDFRPPDAVPRGEIDPITGMLIQHEAGMAGESPIPARLRIQTGVADDGAAMHRQVSVAVGTHSSSTNISRLLGLVALLVVVALLGAGLVAYRIEKANTITTVFTPPTIPTHLTQPPSPLTGPPASMTASFLATKVNLIQADLPPGWVKYTGATAAPAPPSTKIVNALASCLNRPATDLSVLTGLPGVSGPVYKGELFITPTAPVGPPSAASSLNLVPDAADQVADLNAINQPTATSCLAAYYSSLYQGRVTQSPNVTFFAAAEHSGVKAIGFHMTIGLNESGASVLDHSDIIIVGAGRIEVAFGGQSQVGPFPTAVETLAIAKLEGYVFVYASEH